MVCVPVADWTDYWRRLRVKKWGGPFQTSQWVQSSSFLEKFVAFLLSAFLLVEQSFSRVVVFLSFFGSGRK